MFVDLFDVCDLTRSFLGRAMNNLAPTYNALGRHQDALVMQEKTLEFQRRVLPENHPDIGVMWLCLLIHLTYDLTRSFLGQAMGNLAATYNALGRHQDALVLNEKTLEFQRRVLPQNNLSIGVMWLCLLIYLTYDLTRSFVGITMDNLATTYNNVGRHQDALVLQEKALEIQRRLLPENHPDIGVM